MASSRSESKLAERLLSIKEELERQKEQRAELQGELRSLTKRVLEDFGVEGAPAISQLLEEMEAELKNMRTKLNDQLEEIEEFMGKV